VVDLVTTEPDSPAGAYRLRVAVVGTSHVLTMFEGCRLIRDELPAGLEVSFIAQGPRRLGYAVVSPRGVESREPAGTLAQLVGDSSASHVFVSWRGSQANVRGLLLQGPPFDVVLPGEEERAIEPGVELIPCSAVEVAIRATLDRDDQLPQLIAAAKRRGARVWMMVPPPALPEAAVRERLGHESHFAARLGDIGLSAADVIVVAEPVRVRLHTLLLRVYRKFAADHGAGFCPPPPAVADARGLLLPRYWGRDVTHGNADFGAAYLRTLVSVAAADRA